MDRGNGQSEIRMELEEDELSKLGVSAVDVAQYESSFEKKAREG
jgi:hypothetical protein